MYGERNRVNLELGRVKLEKFFCSRKKLEERKEQKPWSLKRSNVKENK